MKTLILTVGLSGSGKSTWAKTQIDKGVAIVNPDSIRLAMHGRRYLYQAEPWVWIMARTMVEALFLAGHDIVILDATNLTNDLRDKWMSPKWETKYKLFNTSKEECIKRAGTDTEIIAVIERMAEQIEWPTRGILQ